MTTIGDLFDLGDTLGLEYCEPLVLESVSADELDRELESARNRETMRRLLDRQPGGTAGDLTPDMFGQGDVPLLSREWELFA